MNAFSQSTRPQTAGIVACGGYIRTLPYNLFSPALKHSTPQTKPKSSWSLLLKRSLRWEKSVPKWYAFSAVLRPLQAPQFSRRYSTIAHKPNGENQAVSRRFIPVLSATKNPRFTFRRFQRSLVWFHQTPAACGPGKFLGSLTWPRRNQLNTRITHPCT